MNAITSLTAPSPCTPAWGITLKKPTKNDWQLCQRSMANWLRVLFPRDTEFHVQAATGIPSSTVSNWLYLKSKPSFEHASILMCVFGPAFLRACLKSPPGWVLEAVRQERLEQIAAEQKRLDEELQLLAG